MGSRGRKGEILDLTVFMPKGLGFFWLNVKVGLLLNSKGGSVALRQRDNSFPHSPEAQKEFNFFLAEDCADVFHLSFATWAFSGIAAPNLFRLEALEFRLECFAHFAML